MGYYLSLDYRKEIKRRIQYINSIRENLIDAKAELHELEKRNLLSKSYGSGDRKESNGSGSNTDPVITMSQRIKLLRALVADYEAIITDYERGMKLLDETEKDILSMRFGMGMSQNSVAIKTGYDRRSVARKENDALCKMETVINKI